MSQASLSGKVCIVTGANTGIGKATATALARQGAQVILACRDQARGEAALTDVKRDSGSAMVSLELLDLGSLASIRAFAGRFKAAGRPLHVLVNNAATVPTVRGVTVDGFETQFGVNHLGPFLLTNLLLDVMKASAPSRVVNVSSSIHNGAALDFDDLQNTRKYKTFAVYGQSKLANLYFTYELARRLQGSGVSVNALHPGVISTELARDMPAPFRLMTRLFFKSPDKGARTSVYLASSPEAANVTGKYFIDCRPVESSPVSRDPAVARQLWEISERLTSGKAAA
jgi:NAD(P)-dependent dehydrogenase (short-subunit alcohol dehydrogenase family)